MSAEIRSIDELIGSHPSVCRSHFDRGTPVDPMSLAGKTLRGEMLSHEVLRHAYRIGRPVFRAASKALFGPSWDGMHFAEDGASGTNLFVGRPFLAFACRVGPTTLDGAPALLIMYDEVPNRWPTKGLHDEVRRISPTAMIGCTIRGGGPTIWFGIDG